MTEHVLVAADGPYLVRVNVSRWDCDLAAQPVGLAWIAYDQP